jgi:hypothetical protein
MRAGFFMTASHRPIWGILEAFPIGGGVVFLRRVFDQGNFLVDDGKIPQGRQGTPAPCAG